MSLLRSAAERFAQETGTKLTVVSGPPPPSGPRPLTARQKEIYDFIVASICGVGYPPTLREVASRFGIKSTNGVDDHLKRIAAKGWIKLAGKGKSRAIRVLVKGAACPMCGAVKAGRAP